MSGGHDPSWGVNTVAIGHNVQLTRQIGEHLVAAEPGLRGDVAAPFAGNVPMFEPSFGLCRSHPSEGDQRWIVAVRRRQFFGYQDYWRPTKIKSAKILLNPDLLCVFVLLKEDRHVLAGSSGSYFQQLSGMLRGNNGLRRKNPQSLHCAVGPKDLEKFRDNWPLVSSRFLDNPATSPDGESRTIRRMQKPRSASARRAYSAS